jgi:hypothetical protein
MSEQERPAKYDRKAEDEAFALWLSAQRMTTLMYERYRAIREANEVARTQGPDAVLVITEPR